MSPNIRQAAIVVRDQCRTLEMVVLLLLLEVLVVVRILIHHQLSLIVFIFIIQLISEFAEALQAHARRSQTWLEP